MRQPGKGRKKAGRRGFFVTLEGVEGCGKSTQAALLARRFRRGGARVVLTSEPGGTATGRAIRAALLAGRSRIDPAAELLLFEADRACHVREVILPALRRGRTVVCDRYSDSSRAYQGAGRGLGALAVEMLDSFATGGLHPDLTLVLDLPAREGLMRVRRRGKMSRIDRETVAFHEKVRRAYRGLAARSGGRIRVVPASGERGRVAAAVWREVERARAGGRR